MKFSRSRLLVEFFVHLLYHCFLLSLKIHLVTLHLIETMVYPVDKVRHAIWEEPSHFLQILLHLLLLLLEKCQAIFYSEFKALLDVCHDFFYGAYFDRGVEVFVWVDVFLSSVVGSLANYCSYQSRQVLDARMHVSWTVETSTFLT